MLHPLRVACLVVCGLIVLLFADAPFKTLGQRYVVHRSRERFVLATVELDLVALWAVAVFYFHWHRRLLPAHFELPLAILGLLLSVAGAGLAAWAKLRLGRWFSGTFAVKPGHELVTDGPYGITRHPMYTGLLLLVAGGALAWDSALSLLLAALLAVPFFLHTVVEEALFEEHFGAAYRDYQRRVPRLVPFAGRGKKGA